MVRVLTDDLGQRSQVEFLGLLCRHEDQSRGTIAQRRRVCSSDDTTVLEGGPEGGNLIEDDTGILLVFTNDSITLLALNGDRNNLSIEGTFLPSTSGALVRFDGMFVEGLTGQAMLHRGVLATVTHGKVVVGIPETIGLQ